MIFLMIFLNGIFKNDHLAGYDFITLKILEWKILEWKILEWKILEDYPKDSGMRSFKNDHLAGYDFKTL
jgi:hypothetical protein